MKLKKHTTSKIVIAVSLTLITVFLAFNYLGSQPKKADTCQAQMQRLDPKTLSLDSQFTKAKKAVSFEGKFISYSLGSSSQIFSLKDSQEKQYQLRVILNKPAEIKLEQNTYTDALENIFKIKDANLPEISYQLELPENLTLDDSLGGFVTVKVKNTGEELLMFKYPQGTNAAGERIDFSFKLDGNTIAIIPLRDWQLGCADSSITLYSQITAVAWDEALVMVGDNCEGNECLKDGDIMQVRPAGWNWGTEERKVYAIVKIPKSPADQRNEYSSRTIDPPDLARYAIDYTALATAQELQDIRNPKKVSPVLDATSKLDVIRKKPDPKLSIIPSEKHLAFAAAEKLKNQKGFWDKIIPSAKAAGAVVKTIGTAANRDYSDIQTWETAQDGDLVTAQEIHVGEVYKDSVFGINSAISFADSTTNSSYYMHLTATEGDRHRGIRNTGVKIDCKHTGTSGLIVQNDYTRIEWLEITQCDAANGHGGIRFDSTATQTPSNSLAQNILIYDMDQGQGLSSHGIIFGSDGGANDLDMSGIVIRNCVIYDGDSAGIRGQTSVTMNVAATIENCTIYGAGVTIRGIYEEGTTTTFTVRNVIVMDTTTDDIFVSNGTVTNALCEDNAADCAAGGAGVSCTTCQTNQNKDTQFVSNATGGKEDLHLKSGSAAIDSGTTVSGWSYDIDLESRPVGSAWDIGADEFNNQNPVSYWNFDEGHDSTNYDANTTFANNLTMSGATWQTDDMCISGNCLKFDGSNDNTAKTYSSDTELAPATTSATISTWFKHTSNLTGTDTVIGRFATGGYKIYTSSSGLCFGIDNDGTSFPSDSACTTTTYADSKWHHLAAVKNGITSIELYIDGIRVGSDFSITASSISGSSANFVVGDESTTATTPWDGFVDEVKYFAFAKTASQVAAEYASRGTTKGVSAQFGDPEQQNYLSQNLVGYWKMDETASPAVDSSGNGNSGTWTGGAQYYPNGKFNRSIIFDGSGDYVSVTDSASISLTSTITIAAWASPSASLASRALVVKNNSYRVVTDGSGNPLCQVHDGSSWQTAATSNTALTLNVMRHVACTYDGSTTSIYVDGQLTGTSSVTASIGDNANALEFGRDAGGTYSDLDGHLDEVRLYSRALSSKEAESLYNWSAGPVGWWKMDENTGDTAYDSSGTGSYGTLTNGPKWVTGKIGAAVNTNRSQATVSIPDPADGSLDFEARDSFTMMAWIRTSDTSGNAQVIIDKDINTANPGYRMRLTLSYFLGCDYDDSIIAGDNNSTSTALNDGKWHHVACVRNGTGTKPIYHYVDGVPVKITDVDDSLNTLANSTQFEISQNATTQYFRGDIDDTRVYRYALSTKQIVQAMNAGHPTGGSPVSSQTAYWKFDEAQGQTVNNSNSSISLTTNRGTTSGSESSDPAWVIGDCKLNGCLDYDMSDDVTTVTNTNAIDFDVGLNSGVTFSAWINPDTVGESSAGEIFRKSATTYCRLGGSAPFHLSCSLDLTSDATKTVFSAIPSGTWTHVALTWTNDDDDEITLWINGRAVGSSIDGVGPPSSDSSNLSIGGGTSNNFDGRIDEFKIYSSELSADEMLIDKNAGSATVLGSFSTKSDGLTATNSAAAAFCIPGDSSTCNPPVGWWKLDNNTGTTAVDSSGNGNNGSFVGNPTWGSNCKSGSCINTIIDGQVADHVAIDDTASAGILDFSDTQDYTTSIWVKVLEQDNPEVDTFPLWKGGSAASTIGYAIDIDASTATDPARCAYTDGNADVRDLADSLVDVVDGQWHFISCVMDRNGSEIGTAGLHIFVDGILKASDTTLTEGSAAGNTNDLRLGERSNSNDFTGSVDDTRIYNYARTPAQITWDYNRHAPIGWWKFDECSGYNAFDASLNANGASDAKIATISATVAGGNTKVQSCNSGDTADMWHNGTTGKFNSSLDFDGTDDYVEVVTEPANLDFLDSQDFTVEAWFNRDTFTTDDTVLAKKSDQTTAAGYLLYIDDSTDDLNFVVADGTDSFSVNGRTALTSTGWHHVVAVYDDDSATGTTIYLDGVADKESVSGTLANVNSLANSIRLRIGAEADVNGVNWDNPFDGRIDNVKIYQNALTATQVKLLYNEGAAVRFGPNTGSP